MKKYINSNIKCSIISLLAGFLTCSCYNYEWDEFKKYTQEGEIIYPGKLKEMEILSGKGRVLMKAELNADPKISKLKVYWNDYRDSVEFPVEKTSGLNSLEHIFEVDEGVKNFIGFTFDQDGNRSVLVDAVGTSYGEGYRRKLSNRFIESLTFNSDNTVINWGQMDPSLGAEFTELEYSLGDEELKTIITPAGESHTLLEGVTSSTTIRYRTVFRPEVTSIDTFALPFLEELIVVVPQLQNAQVPFVPETRSGRWGTLAGWMTNDAIKIHDGQGGWDEWNGNIFNVESGWGAPAIENGKIYQTLTLEPGNYTFEISDLRDTNLTENDHAYLVAALGSGLPDVEDVQSSLAHVHILEGKDVNELKVTFIVEETSEVSVGFLTTQSGDTPGRYCNIRAFNFYKN
ncbi:DUF4998 domain-containing protein [Algoriphagus sp. Y33]|uniref:DUF4998 domain-containing protein n=1 Tax=Algoriphagus sp. Y33 TaxID=2772483 RepID=UPI00177C05B3|nr:DUF4998 domain-containing protein [Algoriphagus sp. Y33]